MAQEQLAGGMDEALLIRVIDGEATPEEAAMVARWLEASADNRALYFRIKDVLDHQRTASYRIDTEAAWQQVRRRTTRRIKPWQYAAAAVLVLGIAAGVTRFISGGRAPAMTQLVAESSQRTARLPDGSQVYLRPGASIRYSGDFGKSDRNVSVTGTALFDVAPVGVPFTVRSGDWEVQVLGTEFVVTPSTVTVQQGKVKAISNQQEFIVLPNQQVTAAGGKLHKQQVNATLYAAWKDGEYAFDNTSLRELSAIIHHNYGYDLVVNQPEKFEGVLLSGHMLIQGDEELLAVLSSLLHATARKNGNTITIQPK